MRYFILGQSHTGKTPLARRLAAHLGVAHVAASAWVRERFPEPRLPDDAPAAERAAYVDRITRFALAELARDPEVSVASLRRRVRPDEPCVIEGMRNPYDFTACFDPRTDRAVLLTHTRGAPPTAFERGLDVIRAYLGWLVDVGLLAADAVREYRFAEYGAPGEPRPDTLEHAIADVLVRASPVAAAARGRPARVHADIPPIATRVRAEYLYDMDPARAGELRPCTAFTISSYPGSAPTFQILLGDGAVFSYVPIDALVGEGTGPALDHADLVYHDCRGVEICVDRFAALAGPVLAYMKRRDLWLEGTYLFTVDWYTGNDLLHALALANGQYALLPNHKVKFGDHPPGFAPYKKLRRTWTTGA